MILDDPSIKGQLDSSNFQIISGLNNQNGLQKLFVEAREIADEAKLPKKELDKITGDLITNLIINQNQKIGSITQSFNIGNQDKAQNLLVIPYGPNTSNAKSPFNAVGKIVAESLMMIEVQKAREAFKANNPGQKLEKMPDILVPAVDHLKKAKALAESYCKNYCG